MSAAQAGLVEEPDLTDPLAWAVYRDAKGVEHSNVRISCCGRYVITRIPAEPLVREMFRASRWFGPPLLERYKPTNWMVHAFTAREARQECANHLASDPN